MEYVEALVGGALLGVGAAITATILTPGGSRAVCALAIGMSLMVAAAVFLVRITA